MEGIDLSYFVKTKADAQDFSYRLGVIVQKIFGTNFSLEKELLEQFGITRKDKFLLLLRDNNVAVGSPMVVKDFLQKLQLHISKLPVLSVCLPIEPKEQTLRLLSEWFMINIKRQVLLDVTVDQTLIAGLTVNFQGKFLDFSIKPLYEKICADALNPQPAVHAPINPAVSPVQYTSAVPTAHPVPPVAPLQPVAHLVQPTQQLNRPT